MANRTLWQAGLFSLAMALAVAVASFWRPTHFIADSKPKLNLETLFPRAIGEWEIDRSIVPLQPPPDLQKVIAETYDQTLARTYRNPSGERMMLSIAYGRNQHEGMNTHRPEICYPGQGFPIVADSRRVTTLAYRGQQVKVTKLVAATGNRVEPITYWLIVGDEITTYGSGHKFVTLEYGLRGQIPDGMLIRISSIDPDSAKAFQKQEQFIGRMLDSMGVQGRVTVLGRTAPPPA